MNIYVDDSGDGGFQFDKGSSIFVAFAAVIFDNPQELEPLSDSIRELQKEHNYKGELKFNKNRPAARLAILDAIGQSQCRVRVIAADKRYIFRENLKESPSALKSYLIRQLLSQHDNTIHNAKVFIDGRDTRGFTTEKSDHSYFMRMCNRTYPSTASDFKFVDSKANIGIQVADMVVGAAREKYEKGNSEYFDKVKRKTWRKSGGSDWHFTQREVEEDILLGQYVQPWKMKAALIPSN